MIVMFKIIKITITDYCVSDTVYSWHLLVAVIMVIPVGDNHYSVYNNNTNNELHIKY